METGWICMKKTTAVYRLTLSIIIIFLAVLVIFLTKHLFNLRGTFLSHKNMTFMTFEQRLNYMTAKLQGIHDEILANSGEEPHKFILQNIDGVIEETADEETKKSYEFKKQRIIGDMTKTELYFYDGDILNIANMQAETDIGMPNICIAQGQRWCMVTAGLIFALIDPEIEKTEKLYSVTVPEADENVGTVIISAKYINKAYGKENDPYNKMIFNNAMRYVYKFFEGNITKRQLDNAINKVIQKGQSDRTVTNILSVQKQSEMDSEQLNDMYVQVEKAQFFPNVAIEKKFKGQKYIFKYDNSKGNIIIEFPIRQ